MTRPLLILLVAAALTCLIGVPVLVVTADDDAPATHGAHGARPERNAGDVDAKSPRAGLFDWLRALALAENVPATSVVGGGGGGDDDASLGAALGRLDHAFDDGIARCAPEIMGYDRGLLLKMQPDWHILKPNLRPTWAAWQKLPGVVVDDVKVKECNDLFASKPGPAPLDCAAMAAKFQECTVPFRGTLGEGSPCDAAEQCASGSCEGGTCTRPDDCKKNTDCPTGMMCASDPDEGIYTCVDVPKAGQDCVAGVVDDRTPESDNRCPAGMACDDDDKCFPVRREGARCGPGQPCAPALSCMADDDGDMVCQKDTVDVPSDLIDDEDLVANNDGDPDRNDDDDESCACDPLRDGKACIDGRCVPAHVVELGDACDDAHLCRNALGVNACIDGVCQKALGVGDACSSHDECKDDYVCENGACTPPGRPGAPCSDNDACIFGLVCNTDAAMADGNGVCGLEVQPGDDEPIREPIPIGDIVIRGDDVPSDDPGGADDGDTSGDASGDDGDGDGDGDVRIDAAYPSTLELGQ